MKKPVRGLRADGEATRSRILEAAGELFAMTGYAETPNKAIAAHAQVDLASINYHFGNRSGLYQAVLVAAHSQLFSVTALQQLVGGNLPPSSKLRAVIEQLVEQATREPQAWQLRVLSRELLAPTSHLQILIQDEGLPKIALLKHMVSEITHIPAQDPALTRCLLNIIAPCLMLLVGSRTFPGPLQEISRMPAQTITDHLYRFAMGGLEAVSQLYAQQVQAPDAGDDRLH